MRLYRQPTTLVLVVRCLFLSFAGRSALVSPARVAAVTAASLSGGTETPPHHVDTDRTLLFVRQPPPPPLSSSSSSSGIASTAHDRRRVSGVGRLRHRDAAVAFRESRPVVDFVAPADSLPYSVSAGNRVASDVEDRVGNRTSEHRTATAAVDDDDDDDDAAERDGDMTSATARRRLPDVIIIGAKKSGTRALLEFLKIHPDVRAAGPETHFFDRFYDRGLDWYRSRMPATSSGQLTVEKTPSYLVSGRVVDRVFTMDRGVRLLVVVRDPVTRAVSDYTQAAAKRPDIAPFERLAFVAPPRNLTDHAGLDCWTTNETGACQVNTSWGAIRIGLYVRHVTRWLRRFPLSQIHFVHGERLVADPAGQMRLVERFLRLRPVVNESNFRLDPVKRFLCIVRSAADGRPAHCLGKTKGRVHRTVAGGALSRLREFFRPFNEQFYRVVGVDFGWS